MNKIKIHLINWEKGDFLAVQWLRLHAFTAGALVQPLVGELRSHMPCGAARKPPPQNEKI